MTTMSHSIFLDLNQGIAIPYKILVMKFKAVNYSYKDKDVKILCQITILIWREKPQENEI